MFYKEILEQTGLGSAFLVHVEAKILKMFLLSGNNSVAFVKLKYVPVYLQKLWIRHWPPF